MAENDPALGQALQQWGQGQQEAAIETAKSLAESGERGGLLLTCWLLQQSGRWEEGVPYALRASELGDPWVLSLYFGQLVEQEARRPEAIKMVRNNPMGGVGTNDPIGRAVEFANNGDIANAAEMIRAAADPHPWPADSDLGTFRERAIELGEILDSAKSEHARLNEAFSSALTEVQATREKFETRGKTLTELLDNLTNASSQKFFEDEASKYEKEDRRMWFGGVVVLGLAAIAALLPLLLNYVSSDHKLEGQSNVSAHLGAALAFAAVAGVLLARARNRDHARQRARDLSVALGTMITYSEQMANEEERQRFKHDMGRLVLETFLRQQPVEDSGSRNVLADIAAAAGPKQPGP